MLSIGYRLFPSIYLDLITKGTRFLGILHPLKLSVQSHDANGGEDDPRQRLKPKTEEKKNTNSNKVIREGRHQTHSSQN